MSGKREKKLRKELRKEISGDPSLTSEFQESLQHRAARLEDICRRLKAREGRIAVGLLAFKVAWNKKDALAVNKFVTDLLGGDLAEAVKCVVDRDLAFKMVLTQLETASARLSDLNETTEVDAISGTISNAKSLYPYFWFNHDGTEPEKGKVTPPSPAPALAQGGNA